MAKTCRLTAAEGADRVAGKFRDSRRRTSPAQSQLPLADHDSLGENTSQFRCENCGCREFYLLHEWRSQKLIREALPCECHDGHAATRELCITYINTWTGPLTPDHHVEWDDKRHEFDGREEVARTIYSKKCMQESEGCTWEIEEEGEVEKVDEEGLWEVHCSQCLHEVEFGWSHPGRGGRIWPCESADFNPWLSWPEERFTEAWKKRGWLRPLNHKV